jgi:putative ABC transport system permease protein
MLKSYLAIALRHFATQKLYSITNILGLAVGLACFILIGLFVQYELSYDRFFARADRIYRVSRDFHLSDSELHLATIAPQAAALLKQEFPQIEQAARLHFYSSFIVSRGNEHYIARAQLADNELFEIFDFKWLQGDPHTALEQPFTMVLTQTAARRYFADSNPLGQTLTLENKWPVKITGVIADLPPNSHLHFEMLISIKTGQVAVGDKFLNDWGSNSFMTYVLLAPGARGEEIAKGSDAFFDKHMGPNSSSGTQLAVYPLTDIHLRSHRDLELRPPGNITVVYTFSAVAAFILLIACINFMNLATARSVQRAKEVGMRKVVGAERAQVIRQFLGEAMLLVLFAVCVAVALVEITLPFFSAFVQQELTFNYLSDPKVIGLLALLVIFVGLVAGSYPAFYLSAFNAASVLKGDVTRGNAAVNLRRTLVVLQFAISIALLIATAVVYQQMQFTRGMDMGYNRDQIVVLEGSGTGGLGSQWEVMKQQLLADPRISSVTTSGLLPGMPLANVQVVRAENNDPRGRDMANLSVDEDFFKTYEIPVLAGRAFSKDFPTDQLIQPTDERPQGGGAFILSEMAARELGWTPEEAIGKWFEMSYGDQFSHTARGTIVGVVKDAHFESLHSPIKAVVYWRPQPGQTNLANLPRASIRISGQDIPGALKLIDEKWRQFEPGQPLNRRFLDDDLNALYASEQRQAHMFVYFSALAIFVACLGLFGLASFTTEQRTKEIGMRKVLGASVWDIVRLFTTEFTKLVLVANVIAWPVAYILMQRWLANFAYRIDLGPVVFIASGFIALLIAWLTIAAVAARAADSRPILALRYE